MIRSCSSRRQATVTGLLFFDAVLVAVFFFSGLLTAPFFAVVPTVF